MQEMCFQKGHNWNDLHWSKKRGSFIVKNTYINGELNNNLNAAINIKQTGIKIPEETVEEKNISSPMKQ